MSITSAPTVPTPGSPSFASDAYLFTQWMATIGPEIDAETARINAIVVDSYSATSTTSLTIGTGSKSLTIEAGKAFAPGQALLLVDSANPADYMSGQVTSYNSVTGALVVDVTATGGSGVVIAWSIGLTVIGSAASAPSSLFQSARTSNVALAVSDKGKLIDITSGAFTQTLEAAATLGDGWYCYLRNATNTTLTIDPNSAELIDGTTTITLEPSEVRLILCDGTGFNSIEVFRTTYSKTSFYTATNTFTVPKGVFSIRPYAFGKGGNGSWGSGTSASGGGGGCAYGDIAVMPGQAVTITISAGVSTVTVGGTIMLTANPGGDASAGTAGTGGTASKHASVLNGGAYSGGAGGATGGGGGASGSPIGIGGAGGSGGGGGAGGAGGSGGGGGGGGAGGAGDTNASGGAGGPATYYQTGPARAITARFTDPILVGCVSPGVPKAATSPYVSISAGLGAGGGGVSGSNQPTYGGAGGDFGGGGGASTQNSTANGGVGGFGGGGGGAYASGTSPVGYGGAGGYGGGGGGGYGTSGGSGGTGGGACVMIFY